MNTGADLTTINKSDLILLGYSEDWINAYLQKDEMRSISRAGGVKELAYYITIPITETHSRRDCSGDFVSD